MSAPPDDLRLDAATPDDVTLVLRFITELAEYERLSHEVVAREADIRNGLFGPERVASAVIARVGDEPVGFALYFFNFSTFVGRPGLYLEDLFVHPSWRRRGIGRAMLAHLARVAVERGCGRMEWSVLNWNTPALDTYRAIGAQPLSEWTVQRLTGDSLAALAAAAPAAPPSSAT